MDKWTAFAKYLTSTDPKRRLPQGIEFYIPKVVSIPFFVLSIRGTKYVFSPELTADEIARSSQATPSSLWSRLPKNLVDTTVLYRYNPTTNTIDVYNEAEDILPPEIKAIIASGLDPETLFKFAQVSRETKELIKIYLIRLKQKRIDQKRRNRRLVNFLGLPELPYGVPDLVDGVEVVDNIKSNDSWSDIFKALRYVVNTSGNRKTVKILFPQILNNYTENIDLTKIVDVNDIVIQSQIRGEFKKADRELGPMVAKYVATAYPELVKDKFLKTGLYSKYVILDRETRPYFLKLNGYPEKYIDNLEFALDNSRATPEIQADYWQAFVDNDDFLNNDYPENLDWSLLPVEAVKIVMYSVMNNMHNLPKCVYVNAEIAAEAKRVFIKLITETHQDERILLAAVISSCWSLVDSGRLGDLQSRTELNALILETGSSLEFDAAADAVSIQKTGKIHTSNQTRVDSTDDLVEITVTGYIARGSHYEYAVVAMYKPINPLDFNKPKYDGVPYSRVVWSHYDLPAPDIIEYDNIGPHLLNRLHQNLDFNDLGVINTTTANLNERAKFFSDSGAEISSEFVTRIADQLEEDDDEIELDMEN